jgi:hypothetical protein
MVYYRADERSEQMKVNGNDNHMVRRGFVMGVIEANEKWAKHRLVTETGAHCNIGQVLRVMGNLSDYDLRACEGTCDAVAEAARLTGLREDTIWNLITLNDKSKDWKTNVRAVRTYLLGKSYKRAWQIAERSQS